MLKEFFINFLILELPSFEKYLFVFFAHFKLYYLIFIIELLYSSRYVAVHPLSDSYFAFFKSHFEAVCSFCFLGWEEAS